MPNDKFSSATSDKSLCTSAQHILFLLFFRSFFVLFHKPIQQWRLLWNNKARRHVWGRKIPLLSVYRRSVVEKTEKNGEIPVLFAIWKNKEAAPAPGIISSSVNHKYSKQSPSTGICTWPRTVRHLPERLNTRDLSHTYKDNIMLLHYCTSTVLHKRTCSLVIRFWCSNVQFVIWYNLLWYHKAFSVVLHRAAGIPNALSYVLQPQKVMDKSTIDDFCQLSPSISTKFHFLSMCCHMMWMAVCSHILTSNCQVSDALNDKFSSICAITKYLCTNTVIFVYKHCVQNPKVWMYLLNKNTCNNQH